LLAEHKVLEDKIAASAKQLDKRTEAQERKVKHGLELYQMGGGEIAASC